MYKTIIRPILFLFSPETAHHLATTFFKVLNSIPGMSSVFDKLYVPKGNHLEKRLFGLTFRNPVGLAAGFDKKANLYNDFSHLGFGFIEIGTITPKPQDGNPKPRMFRLTKDSGLINRMGFNNGGLEQAVANLKKRKTDIIIGGNIGKNKTTPNEKAVDDYEICFNGLFPYVDYFVVNVSSPNTPNLRELQEKEPLMKLLSHLQNLNMSRATRKPILLKIAPDLTNDQLNDIVDIVQETKIDGIIATNTTIERDGLKSNPALLNEAGGLSGLPVKKRSTEVIRYLHQKSNGSFPIIGVGGISNAQDAKEKLEAGASLVQVYTGFIYEGPTLVKHICSSI
ncbi:MAG: quinone-dependent dihydroorotate dehydrogenase [Flavobacteriales bacterium]|nr:quinone-dependent dihydroorotate dehydrogenase [Flavobacteriales bacterium]